MRPDILNPLFAEVETLPGVGPQVAKTLKRIDITRVVDLLYHLPTGVIERVRARAANAEPARLQRHHRSQALPNPRARSGRGPTRVFASDGDGNIDQPHLFQQSRLGEEKPADGRDADRRRQAGSLWRRVADHSSGSVACGQGLGAADPRAGLWADGRHDQQAAFANWSSRRWSGRPSCQSGSSRACCRGKPGGRGAEPSPRPIAIRDRRIRDGGSLTTRYSPTSLRYCCFARRRGGTRAWRWLAMEAYRQAEAALPTDGRSTSRHRGNPRRHGADRADASTAAGRRRLGQDACRA